MKRRLLFFILSVSLYVIGVVAILAISHRLAASHFVKIDFWVGLVVVIILFIVLDKWPRQSYKFILRAVSIIMLATGITLIFLSQNIQLWENPPWNPSVFGAGVSITALGMALLLAFWQRNRAQAEGSSPLSRKSSRSRFREIGNLFSEVSGKHAIMVLGLLCTVFLLIIFLLLQHFIPSVLQLDAKWIVVTLIPLVLALIIGGYVKVIKGFGFELEASIEEPVITIDLEARRALTSLPPFEKRRIRDLERMSRNQKRRIARLRFSAGRPNYYDASAVSQYMRELPNLEYFEVLSPSGMFLCLIPVDYFKLNEEIIMERIDDFIIALEANTILDEYRQDVTTLSVQAEQRIVDVLEILRIHATDTAIVLDTRGSAVGIVRTSDIEKRIADEVLLAAKRKKK